MSAARGVHTETLRVLVSDKVINQKNIVSIGQVLHKLSIKVATSN